jgi:hypothetical protein
MPSPRGLLSRALRSTANAALALLAPLAVLLAGTPNGPALAQDAPPAAAPARELERTIYIPYKDLEKVFEKDGRGVFLPYEEFMRLWKKAGGGAAPSEVPAPPPVDWAIAAAEIDGKVEGDIATLRFALDVQVLRKGWVGVPLPFSRAAIREAKIGDERAVLAAAEGGAGYRLIAPGPKAYRVELVLATPISSRPGVRSLTVGIPPAAVSRLALRLPEKGVKVEVAPNLAATTRDGEGDTTELLAFLGATNEFRVDWFPRPKEVEEGKPLVFVETRTSVRIEEGIARAETTQEWQVVQASIAELSLRLPEGYTLVRLEGKLVRDFSVEGRIAKVRLHQKARERFEVAIGLERALPEAGGRLAAPAVEAQGVDRETGTVAVAAAEGLGAKVVLQEGVSRVDPSELSEAERAARPFAAYRYLKHPWKLEIEVARIEPEIDLATWTILTVGEEAATHRAILAFDIRRAGVFGWRITIPKGWQALEVGVVGDARASAALVKDFRVIEAGDAQRLEVDLPGRTIGAHRLELLLSRRRASRTEAIELPRVAVEGVRRESGLIAVAVAQALEAVTAKSEGLRPVAAAEAAGDGLAPQRRLGEPDAELRLAFRYARPPYSASFELKPRRPVVSAEAAVLATVADDVLKVETQIGYQVLYAGIRALRIAVPSEIADLIEIEGAGIQEKRREEAAPATGTAAPTEAVFRVLLQTDAIGAYTLRASWKKKLGELTSGGSVDVALAAVRVLDVFNETGHIAVQKGDDLVIEPESAGLEPVDARELPPSLRDRGGIFRSYRYLAHPFSLSMKVVKHEFAPVLDTMIDAERVEAVVTRERVARCEATLFVQNNRRQFLEARLPDESELLAVYVDGQLIRPARGDRKETALISLPKGRTGANPIRLTVRWDVPLGPKETLGATGRLEVPAPSFPAGAATIPVGRSRLDLYLPNDFRHMSFESRMQRRFAERRLLRTVLGWIAPEPHDWFGDADFARPAGAAGGDALDVKLVREGRLHVFTALESASGASFRYMSPALFYALVGTGLLLGAFGTWRAMRVFGAPSTAPAIVVALFGLGAFAGEATGAVLDAALSGALLAALARAGRYAFVDAPRARREAATERLAGLQQSADRQALEKIEREVESLRAKVEAPAAPAPDRAAGLASGGGPAGGPAPGAPPSPPAPPAPPAPPPPAGDPGAKP